MLSRYNQLLEISKRVIFHLENNQLDEYLLPSKWIWSNHRKSQHVYFRYEFNLESKVKKAYIQFIANNVGEIYLNGFYIGTIFSRNSLSYVALTEMIKTFEITSYLRVGKNSIAIEAKHFLHSQGCINLFGKIAIKSFGTNKSNSESYSQKIQEITTNSNWMCCNHKFEDWSWIEPSYKIQEDKDHKWHNVRVLKQLEKNRNEILFKPDLLNGHKSIPRDLFLYFANVKFYSRFLSTSWFYKIKLFIQNLTKFF
jgi:hypothetical protein